MQGTNLNVHGFTLNSLFSMATVNSIKCVAEIIFLYLALGNEQTSLIDVCFTNPLDFFYDLHGGGESPLLCQVALNAHLMIQSNGVFASRQSVSSGNIIILYSLTHAL